jgi:hypothetical protein
MARRSVRHLQLLITDKTKILVPHSENTDVGFSFSKPPQISTRGRKLNLLKQKAHLPTLSVTQSYA